MDISYIPKTATSSKCIVCNKPMIHHAHKRYRDGRYFYDMHLGFSAIAHKDCIIIMRTFKKRGDRAFRFKLMKYEKNNTDKALYIQLVNKS